MFIKKYPRRSGMHDDKLSLLGILDSISKIEAYTACFNSYEQFSQDSKTMDACLMHLVNIGAMAARLSDEVLKENTGIDWYKIRGMRNIIAHDYFGIDYREIWAAVSIHIPILKIAIIELTKS